MSISKNIQKDLLQEMDAESVFQKHVIDGPSAYFVNSHYEPNDEYDLRRDIANATGTNIHDAIIIGSAKLGFSVKTEKFEKFDAKYDITKNIHHKSDIDVALINREYFDQVAEAIYHLSCHFDQGWIQRNWLTNQYYIKDKNLMIEYSKYIARGWLRPDFMPNSYLKEAAWLNPCNSWTSKLGRKVSIGIYSNWTYLKHYHIDHLQKLKAKLITLEIT